MKREIIGEVPCLCCARDVPAKKGDKGAISVSCPWCDLSAYAKEGTEAARIVIAKIKPGAAAPIAAATPAVPASPAPASGSTGKPPPTPKPAKMPWES